MYYEHTQDQDISESTKVFISYAHEDSDLAENVYNDLKNVGLDPWLDKNSILGGDRWKDAIEAGIKNSEYFVILLSKNSTKKRGMFIRSGKKHLINNQSNTCLNL